MGKLNRRSSSDSSSEGAPEWMTTYSDLVTLLLTFFILLFSMAVIDKQKFVEVADSLRSSFLHISNGEMYITNKGKDMMAIVRQNNAIDKEKREVNNESEMNTSKDQGATDETLEAKEQKLQNVKKKVEGAIVKLKLESFVSVVEEKLSLILRLDSVILFDVGKAELKPSGKDVLKKLGTLFKGLENEILVQGHTDNLPIKTLLYPTNWELSTKRATNVVLFLINECGLEPSKLTATGNGEFKPIRPNDTEENRQKNRRIDMVIEK